MPAKALESMDDFTGHSGSESSGGGILKWREDEEGSVDVVLHTKAPIYAVWSSSWYTVDKDRETGEDKLFFMRFNSMEDEKILKKQRFRARSEAEGNEYAVRMPWHSRSEEPVGYVGLRQYPPVICPFSLMVEWVREQVEIGDLGLVDKIFEFDTGKDGVVIHAGGFCGLLGGKDEDYSKDELTAMRKAGIKRREAYKEDGKPRMQYVICALDYAKPEDGVVVCIEAQALGDKLKKQIKDRKDDLGADEGDPKKTPVVFRWKYDGAQDFAAKYDVQVRTKAEITPEILEAITGEYPKEKVERIIADSNLITLRRSFEEHWCHKKVTPPWDAIFAAAEAAMKGTPAMKDPDEDKPAKGGKSKDEDDNEGDDDSDQAGDDEQGGGDTDEIECDHCHKGMSETDTTCPHCGATYVINDDGSCTMTPPQEKKEEAPKRRSRAAAAAGSAPSRSKS
jgi:hypothetical protein